ncbi:terpenoid synthase [Mycena metata]|uniref:Terpene synthase n=1 Tax=Mycena metata TaxID=1033252 RepID=A0AAD7HH32_9AGAR|nr:terpenoid synthase [Mycena metata]
MSFLIPNTLRSWPWPRQLNPHYSICKAESSAWCEGFKAFDARAQKSFNRCDFNLLASLAFPLLNKDAVGCYLMNLFFVIDEHTDIHCVPGHPRNAVIAATAVARQQADIVMDALHNPRKVRPSGEWIGGKVAQEFWLNAITIATPTSQRRFLATFRSYLNAVVQQARNSGHIRDVNSYFQVRRDTIGAKPSFAINEIHLNIPDEIITHPVIVRLTNLCLDALIIGNDLCSYNVEQGCGDDGHNLVTIVMHQHNLDVQGAINWISYLHDNIADEFCRLWARIPTFCSPVDREIRTYTDSLGNWIRANDQWSFESERYFGKEGLEIQRTRRVTLLPRVNDHIGGKK